MPAITIIAVGKIKSNAAYLQPGIEDYLKRLKPYGPVQFVEVPEETVTPTRTREQVIEAEGKRLLAKIDSLSQNNVQPTLIGLSEHGWCMSSEKLADRLFQDIDDMSSGGTNPPNGGMRREALKPMILLIGGPLGLSQSVLSRCHWVLSLSPMTFPHQMVRLLLLEQLYRSFRIHRGEPYHK